MKAVEAAQRDVGLPASTQLKFQGTALAFQASLVNQLWLILAAIVTVYIVLGVLYESYIHPITILSTLPSAGVGALLALLVSGHDLGVIAIIGIILLIGIVKKNAILMIDFALDAQREQGMAPRDAIFQACLLRFRPIMMTTMAALLGALPLMIGWGVGAELRHPLGITMVGGLLVSQVLTLFTTPVVYLAFDRLARRASERRERLGAAAPPAAMRHEADRMNVSTALHPPPGRDDAAHDRDHACRRCGVPASSGISVAAGGPADHFGISGAGGGEPRDDGSVRRNAARAVAGPHCGHQRNDFEQRPRASTRIVLQFDLDRDINAAAREVQAALNAARGSLPAGVGNNPTYRKVNPAVAPIMILGLTSDDDDPGTDVRRGFDDHRAEAVPVGGRGSGPGGGQFAARGAGRNQSPRAVQVWHRL